MTYPFNIVEHVIPGQHIREYLHGLKGRQEAALKIAIKQYIPQDRPDPVPENAVTIIGLHGNGSLKEMLEPLWEDLYTQLKTRSISIRGIWVAEMTNQGASGVLNEDIQGDNTNWNDHSRDLLHMINHFRDEMPRPIIGVAHSMGCAQLVNLAIIHPRLLSTVLLYEPVILDPVVLGTASDGPNPAMMSTLRPDLWETSEEGEAAIRKMFRRYNPRVLDRYVKYGLRAVPTSLYPEIDGTNVPATAVTLTTSKHHEAWNFVIPNFEPESAGLDKYLLPDWDPVLERPALVARPESAAAFRNLPFLRPSVLWVFGGWSYLSAPPTRDAKMAVTGTGIGGSGGAARGMVESVVLEKGGHMIPLENVEWCATVGAEWIEKWFKGYLSDEEFWKTYPSKKSDPDMLRGSEAWVKVAKSNMSARRPGETKGKL